MGLVFHKMHGTGNDFIILDAIKDSSDIMLDQEQIQRFCDRKFGVGADGLIIIRPDSETDFYMDYYNADGNKSSMCGNGGRCSLRFAMDHDYSQANARFRAIDGIHSGSKEEHNISLKMNDVNQVSALKNGCFVLDTGSPHYVEFKDTIISYDVVQNGRNIRNNQDYIGEGINVNFVSQTENNLFVRTYERGVENETLSCGTGVTAAAIAAYLNNGFENSSMIFHIETLGGRLKVRFEESNGQFKKVYLIGPAEYVFSGIYRL